jgi:hypothetical protein
MGSRPSRLQGTEAGEVAKRSQLVESVKTATSAWLAFPSELEGELLRSDHHVDAHISALVGRAVEVGQTLPIPAECREYAMTEGWIHLPQEEPLAAFNPGRPVP